jgi:phosphoglycolate phosphatase
LRQHLIFDLDGTLIDSNAECVAILQEMLDKRAAGRIIDAEEAAIQMSMGGVNMVQSLLADDCGDPVHELADFRARYAERTTDANTIFSGVSKGLAQLDQAGFTLAICSNKPENLCIKVLADTGLDRHFTAIVGGKQGLRPKPAPDLLEAVLEQLATPPGDCLYVGDSEIDHALAVGAGMLFCFMTYGYATPGWKPDGAVCFDGFDALVESLIAAGPGGVGARCASG